MKVECLGEERVRWRRFPRQVRHIEGGGWVGRDWKAGKGWGFHVRLRARL